MRSQWEKHGPQGTKNLRYDNDLWLFKGPQIHKEINSVPVHLKFREGRSLRGKKRPTKAL